MSRIVIEFSDPDALAKIDAAVAEHGYGSREQFCLDAVRDSLAAPSLASKAPEIEAEAEPEPTRKKKSKKSKELPSGLADGEQPETAEPQEETAS